MLFVMTKGELDEKERKIHAYFQDTISPYIMELEVRDSEYPVEIMNEIRAIFTHLSRYKLQASEKDLLSAENHSKRAILDCYKYLCISIAEKIYRFRERYKNVDLKLANNGKFLPQLDILETKAKAAFKEAKFSEIKKLDDDEQYRLYESAYNAYNDLDKYIEDSQEAILFASSHSKTSNTINIVAIIVTIASIIFSIFSFLFF